MTTPTCAVDGCDYPAPNHRICVVCQAKLTRDLAELPALSDDLEITLTRQAVLGPGQPGNGHQPLPYDPRASHAVWVLRNTLVTWTRAIHDDRTIYEGPMCESCGHRSCRRFRDGEPWPDDTAPAIARWLYARRLTLLDHVAAEQACDEIGYITREVRRITDRPANRTTFHVGPCPEFDEQGVRCPGEIRAYIPVEDDKPASLQCEASPDHYWEPYQWLRAGKRIREAAARDAATRNSA